MKTITLDTLIPISLVIVLCGGLIYIGNWSNALATTSKRLDVIEADRAPMGDKLDQIRERLAAIEGQLKRLNQD